MAPVRMRAGYRPSSPCFARIATRQGGLRAQCAVAAIRATSTGSAARRGLAQAAAEDRRAALVNAEFAPYYKFITLGLCAAAGWHVLPHTYSSSVPTAAKLCRSKDPFMQVLGFASTRIAWRTNACYDAQRSGLSRIKLMVGHKNLHSTIMLDAAGDLITLVRTSPERDIVESALEILQSLAESGVDGDRELLCLDGAVEALQRVLSGAEQADEFGDGIRAKAANVLQAVQLRDGSVSEQSKLPIAGT